MRQGAPADARLLAYHEAGHAVASFVLKRPFGPLALRPAELASGATPSHVAMPERSLEDAERDVLALLAGAEAEAILTGYCDWFAAQPDQERADAVLTGMLAAGYRARARDEREAELVGGLGDDLARATWELLCYRAHELVNRAPVRSAIAALATALLAHEILTAEQAQRAIRQGLAAADPELLN